MTTVSPVPATTDPALARRRFLRGGALLAATAGGAVVATAVGPVPAQAAGDQQAVSLGFAPVRLLDTRTSDGRAVIVDASSSALDSKGRLKKYAWIDVAVYPGDDVPLLSVYVNVGSRASTAKGTLGVTEPGEARPEAWTLHYAKGAEINNSAISGIGYDEAADVYTVRIYAGSVTHAILDVTGVSALLSPSDDAGRAGIAARRASAVRIAKTVRRVR